MIALRKISRPKIWESDCARWDRSSPAPISIVAEFFPTLDEKDRISVYMVDDLTLAQEIAVALLMARGDGPSRIVFAQATEEALVAAGASLLKSDGETGVKSVDALHRDLIIPDLRALSAVVATFSGCDPIEFLVPEVRAAAMSMVAAGKYDWPAIAAAPARKPNKGIWESGVKMVANRQLQISVPQSS